MSSEKVVESQLSNLIIVDSSDSRGVAHRGLPPSTRPPPPFRKVKAGGDHPQVNGDGEEEVARDDAADGEAARGSSGPLSPELPDDCMLSILSRIPGTKERNAFALASRHCWELDAATRTRLRLGPGVQPATFALERLADRFMNLRSIHFDYLGWKSGSGPQLGDEALQIVVSRCVALTDLSLSFCGFVTDSGMAYLAQCPTLKSLRLNFLPCLTGRGLLSVVLGCPQLEGLHVERCSGLRSSEWLEALGTERKGNVIASAPNSPLSRGMLSPLPVGSQFAGSSALPRRPRSRGSEAGSEAVTISASSSGSSSEGSSCSSRRSFDSAADTAGGFSSPVHPRAGLFSTGSSAPSSASSGSGFSSPPHSFGSPQTPSPLALGSATAHGCAPPTLLMLTPPRATPSLEIPHPQGKIPVPVQVQRMWHVGVKRLTVSHCRGIGEGDLAKLGKAGWERLEELRFDMDVHPRDQLLPSVAPFEQFANELNLARLRVLSLSHCPRVRSEGLALVLQRLCTGRKQHDLQRARQQALAGAARVENDESWALRELRLESCPGLNDADVRQLLSAFSSSLRVLSLSLVKWLGGTTVQSPTGTGAAAHAAQAQEQQRLLLQQQQHERQLQQEQQSQQSHHHHQHPHQESTWAVTTASLWYIAEFCPELQELELICRDDFPSSAPLFLGFADAAVADIVASLPGLKRLRVGRGLHLSDGLLGELRQEHPRLSLTLA